MVLTVVLYAAAAVVYEHIATLQETEKASDWLAGFVTLVLAIAAWLAWTFHDRRSRFVELTEIFASVHAELTAPDLLALTTNTRAAPSDHRALRDVWLRNSIRVEVMKKYEDEVSYAASASPTDPGATPFVKLFHLVNDALGALDDLIPDDPMVAAQRVVNDSIFKQDHRKDTTVQRTYSELAEHLAGRPMDPGDSAPVVGDGLPFDIVTLSRGGQAVELAIGSNGAARTTFAWIAGTGGGEWLGSGTGHFDRVGDDGKKKPCHLAKASTRRTLLARAQDLASGDELRGRHLARALVEYFTTPQPLGPDVTCRLCRTTPPNESGQ